MNLVHNERVKLLATALNTVATASFALGIIGPAAAIVYNLGNAHAYVSIGNLAGGTAVFLALGVLLHLIARYALGGLRE